MGGMQKYLGVEADLATYGKAIANGFPLAVVAGRKDIFNCASQLWISSTFGGETLSLAAALATLDELERPATTQLLCDLGERLSAGWQTLLKCAAWRCRGREGFWAITSSAIQSGSQEARRYIRIPDVGAGLSYPTRSLLVCHRIAYRCRYRSYAGSLRSSL